MAEERAAAIPFGRVEQMPWSPAHDRDQSFDIRPQIRPSCEYVRHVRQGSQGEDRQASAFESLSQGDARRSTSRWRGRDGHPGATMDDRRR
jgi:hypothetical protein